MRLLRNPAMLIALPLLLLTVTGSSQDSISPIKRLLHQFTDKPDSSHFSFLENNMSFKLDTSLNKKLKDAISFNDSNGLSRHIPAYNTQLPSFSSKPFLTIGRGYLSYNYTYRSGNDSSVIDNNVSQQLITGSFTATIAQTLPVRVTYYERHSNSPFFKDYRDITVDVDVQQYRQLKTQKALNKLKQSYHSLDDAALSSAMHAVDGKLDRYKSLLRDPKMINELIHSRETLIRNDFADTSAHYIDSSKTRAQQFIRLYDSLQAVHNRYAQLGDSLHQRYAEMRQKINRMEKLLNSKSLSAAETEQLTNLYGKRDKNIDQLQQAKQGITKLSVGRTYPSYSNLTVQDINVNGINVEYAKHHYYFAATAGLVDFRIRDFLYSHQKPSHQYLYAARVGFGTKESDHIILTYFRGRKQLFGGNLQQPTTDIQGISLAGQYFIERHIRLFAEVAQSGIPHALGGNNAEKSTIAFNDNSQRAYAAGVTAQFPRMQTFIDGYYQHNGLNYQSFNSFQYNSRANSWSVRFTQSFWKRQFDFQAAFRKNDFINPLVLQRYNANTVFKSFLLTFRKPKWPTISAGYLPASQYTAVGNLIYENHYQTLTATVSHQYRIGIAGGASLFSFSRFYNDNRDTGLVYYNSTNVFVGQTFSFTRFTASLNVSAMNNSNHQLIVMEESFSAPIIKNINAGFGIKVNNLNKIINKVGFTARLKTTWKKVGEFNGWMEQSYLPGLQQVFYKYEIYNIGFIRYFN